MEKMRKNEPTQEIPLQAMIKLNFYHFIYLFGNCGESLEQKPKIEFLGRSEFLAEEMRPGKFNCSSIGGIGNRQ